MVNFCVATDSGCDLPANFCKEKNIFAYRMKYTIDETDYYDNMEPEGYGEFYDKMRKGAVPKTSQMTPYEYIEFWSEIYLKYKLPIIHIAMGSVISGTYANSVIAKNLFSKCYQDAKVYVIDSTLASIGYGMLCIWAADMRDKGIEAKECIEIIEKRKLGVNTYYTTNELKYLYRSGRVTKTKSIVASTLNINPILNLDKSGHLVVREKIRGRKKALARICEIVEKLIINPQEQTLYICHSDCDKEETEALSSRLVKRFKIKDIFISHIGPTIGSHCGPGLIAVFFEGQDRSD